MELSIINPLWSIFSKDLVFIPVHHEVSHHYTLVLIDNEARCFYHLNSMLPPRKDYSADTNNHFQNAMAVVKHIMVFIKRVYDSIKYPLSQGLDLEEWRENYDKQNIQGIVVDGYSMMSAEEKRTKRWMLDQNVYQARYKLKDILSCPQQKKTS
ncbi:hypothetical protein ACLB2K_002322 [Fragaria x ananassa]